MCILIEIPPSLNFWVHDFETAVAARSYTSLPPGCPTKTTPCRSSSWCPPVTSHFPKGGDGAGGHLGEEVLKEVAFFCLLPRPPHLEQQMLCPFLVGSSCCPQLSLHSRRPLPPLLLPPTPSRTSCSAFLNNMRAYSNCPFNWEYRSAGNRYSLRIIFLSRAGTPGSPHTPTLRSKMARSTTTLAKFGGICPIRAQCSTRLRGVRAAQVTPPPPLARSVPRPRTS